MLSRPQPSFRGLPREIASRLERDIISGTYKPGEHLVERQLASQFEVSVSPIREALQTLENRGLVRRKLHHGCTVIDLSPEEIRRCGEFRKQLEPSVMRWAAERIEPSARESLELQLDKVKKAAEADNHSDFFCEDLELHRLLWVQAKNPFAEAALGASMGSLFASGLRDSRRDSAAIDLTESYRKHVRLVDAVLAGDPDAAADALEDIAGSFQDHLGAPTPNAQ